MPQSQHKAAAQTGTCPVCGVKNIKLITSTGGLRKHGHGNGFAVCLGSYGKPFENTSASASTGATGPRPVQQSSGVSSAFERESVGGELTGEGASQRSMSFKPSKPGSVMKWVPRGARAAASALLGKLIEKVVEGRHNLTAWQRLLGFAGGCLTKPPRGGRTRNLTGLVLKQVAKYSVGDEAGEIGERSVVISRGGRQTPRRRLREGLRVNWGRGMSRVLCAYSAPAVELLNAMNTTSQYSRLYIHQDQKTEGPAHACPPCLWRRRPARSWRPSDLSPAAQRGVQTVCALSI